MNGQLLLRSVRERHTQRTSIAGILAFGACAVVWTSTNATHIVVRHVPPPSSNGIPSLDPHFHVGFGSAVRMWDEEESYGDSWAGTRRGFRRKIKTRRRVIVIGSERARCRMVFRRVKPGLNQHQSFQKLYTSVDGSFPAASGYLFRDNGNNREFSGPSTPSSVRKPSHPNPAASRNYVTIQKVLSIFVQTHCTRAPIA